MTFSLYQQARLKMAADIASGLVYTCPNGSRGTVLNCPWPGCGEPAVAGWSSCGNHFTDLHRSSDQINTELRKQAVEVIKQGLAALFPYADPKDDPDRARAADQVIMQNAIAVLEKCNC